jgi:hypothetical protein
VEQVGVKMIICDGILFPFCQDNMPFHKRTVSRETEWSFHSIYVDELKLHVIAQIFLFKRKLTLNSLWVYKYCCPWIIYRPLCHKKWKRNALNELFFITSERCYCVDFSKILAVLFCGVDINDEQEE